MYTLKTEHSFDAAHFLYGYEGKCSNIHGHRWRVVAEVSSDELETTGQNRGMYVDFGDLKKDLKEIVDYLDHCLIIETGSLKETTLKEMMEKKPEKVIELAVKGMLPKGPLGRQMYTKLFVYAGPDHKHAAQKPEALTF